MGSNCIAYIFWKPEFKLIVFPVTLENVSTCQILIHLGLVFAMCWCEDDESKRSVCFLFTLLLWLLKLKFMYQSYG